jgi:hypothetical protein
LQKKKPFPPTPERTSQKMLSLRQCELDQVPWVKTHVYSQPAARDSPLFAYMISFFTITDPCLRVNPQSILCRRSFLPPAIAAFHPAENGCRSSI